MTCAKLSSSGKAPTHFKEHTMFTRKIRGTGETLTVGTAVELGVDPEAGKWVTICEDHHTIANSATQSLAYYTHGRDFCDGCRADFEGICKCAASLGLSGHSAECPLRPADPKPEPRKRAPRKAPAQKRAPRKAKAALPAFSAIMDEVMAPAPATAPIKLAFANGQDIKVHAASCADLKKAATKRAAHNGIHTQEFPAGTDERDVWIDFNEDFLIESGADGAYPLEFLPCCHEAGLAKNADRTWSE